MGDTLGEMGHFAEPALLILTSLANGPNHGYGMLEDIERLAGVRLGPGTLYGALARLERGGYIVPLEAQERRRPYMLTDRGRRALHEQLVSLHRIVTAGLTRLERPA